jgi:hypothetical protein
MKTCIISGNNGGNNGETWKSFSISEYSSGINEEQFN